MTDRQTDARGRHNELEKSDKMQGLPFRGITNLKFKECMCGTAECIQKGNTYKQRRPR